MSSLWRRRSPLAVALLALAAAVVPAVPAASPAAAAVPGSPGPAVVIEGSGWGHSVGMSQYGARAMAQQGRSAPQILQHYYPGTTVADDARVPNSQEIRVDLYRNRVPSGGTRVDLRPVHASDPGAPAGVLRVDLGGGTVREVPDEPGWWVSHDPAGGRYVLHAGDAEAASGPGPVGVTAGPDNAMRVLNLAGSASPYIGSFRWGVLSITGPGDGTLNPVLVQPMQNYLWGIAEVPGSWEQEVLRAQAITARTYAGRFASQVISATPANQAYAGYYKELTSPSWISAVNDTSGVTVTYQGELAQTYYSSSHGLGRSEASEDSWAYGATIPYLRSVDDPFSAAPGNGNPYDRWTAVASNAEFAALAGMARVNTVKIVSRTSGGSPKALEIDGWTPSGERLTCTWSGGSVPCPSNSDSQKGAGAKMRLDLPLLEGGSTNGRIRSQQIRSITLAPFGDDEGSLHQYNIGAVATAGITTGCTPTSYCPGAPVTRAQMATFLGRSLGLTADNGPDQFGDIATSPHRGFINALAKAGRISGYGDGNYGPDRPVSREQMASFLVRAFDVPPASGPDRFSDIGGSVHRERINAAAARRLTGGCTPSTYCPAGQVTREQMASFLARAKGLGE